MVAACEGTEEGGKEMNKVPNIEGLIPESWLCIDCGINTAPGLFNRVEMERAIALDAAKAALEGREWAIEQSYDHHSEVYSVRPSVWKAAGMEPMGGCLCIGCLEKRLGRRLRPKDFPRRDSFNYPQVPGTPRLLERRGTKGGS
jgi:hypothetical protein